MSLLNKNLGVIHFISKIVQPEKFGFIQSYISFEDERNFLYVIYDSKYCRVRFFKDRAARFVRDLPSLQVDYGRLHAPSVRGEKWMGDYIYYNGELCRAWHSRIDLVIGFLERTKIDVMTQGYDWLPDWIKDEYSRTLSESDFGNILSVLRMHRKIWEHYGTRLFDLFDLRRPDLWEKYRLFLEEYYRAEGWEQPSWYPFPPPWKIC